MFHPRALRQHDRAAMLIAAERNRGAIDWR
jgi:hypothetical protein